MYVVTFYSFKGGVGRSMAMMNCAANLVEQGKKVLVVDFDLEAPGLDTFNLDWGIRAIRKGLVDYVIEYLNTDIAPKLDEYVHKGSFKEKSKGELWLLPAGERSSEYHHRLNAINWRHLYEHRDGYLLFENLKAQWKNLLNPDYVLVDSRTGHTDVSGICTRQIPDATVLLFFPNKLNLSGLVPIVKRIREENKNRSKQLRMHFVASNVPDIDDEQSILWKRLQEFRSRLEYEKLAAKIHHYHSLSLLNQEIFAISRPKSRLASEYSELVREIQKLNWQDRLGAISYLKEVTEYAIRPYERSRTYDDSIDETVNIILNHHIDDLEILKGVVIYIERQDQEQALQILQSVWHRFKFKPSYLVMLANFESRAGHIEKSTELAIAATKYKGLSLSELRVIVRLLMSNKTNSVASKTLDSIESWHSVLELFGYELLELVELLSFQRNTLKSAEDLLRRCIQHAECNADDFDDKEIEECQDNLILNLIGQRKFNEAIEYTENLCGKSHNKRRVPETFNLGMAKWGNTQQIPIEEFKFVANSVSLNERDDPNFNQCMSLVYWALDDQNIAQGCLDNAKQKLRFNQFSSWSYLFSRLPDFQKDLEDQQLLLDGEIILPRIISPV